MKSAPVPGRNVASVEKEMKSVELKCSASPVDVLGKNTGELLRQKPEAPFRKTSSILTDKQEHWIQDIAL